MSGLITSRKFFSRILVRLNEPVSSGKPSPFLGLGYFVIGRFAFVLVWFAMFLLEIPLHLFRHTTESFAQAALQGPQHEYQESYSSFVRRQRLAVVSVLASFIFLVGQLTYLGYTVVRFTIPTQVTAQSGSLDINPTWDDSIIGDFLWSEFNPCSITDSQYYFQFSGPSAANLAFGKTPVNPPDCDFTVDYHTTHSRPALKFSLSSIPNNATITAVNLLVNVSNTSPQVVSIYHPTSDDIDTLSSSDGYTAIESGTLYTTATWSTTGAKNVSLGSNAISHIQSRITGSDVFAVGLKTDEQSSDFNNGAIDSVNNATPGNRPILRVTYTIPPPAATGLTHTSNTTSTITWSWTDNATAETRYDVRDGSGNVTGCTNLAANTTSCTETGLSPNTQYTRTVRVTDAQGTSDSASTSAYSSAATPTSVIGSQLTQTSITVAANGAPSNLGVGQTALWFEETVTSSNSGWVTTNTWNKTGLNPNTLYTFKVKARNGDGDETGFTSTIDLPTLAATPSASSTRMPSTWYASGGFPFTSDIVFGAGGAEYYGYAWNSSAGYGFSGTEPTWCSSGCTINSPTLTNPATDGSSWYLHLAAYDATDNNSGGNVTYGPFFFDGTAPTAPATVNDGTGTDISSQASTTSLSANWTTSNDATSGIQKYQYAIGTTNGGTDVRSYTDNGTATTVTASGLTLTAGSAYYISVRAVDVAGNTGAATSSNGVTISSSVTPTPPDTTGPVISSISTDATTTTATVRWATNEPATAKVEYGLTTSYGGTVERTTLATDHQLAIIGLTANMSYHFRIIAGDASGNTTTTIDDAFITVAAPVSGSGITGPTLLRPVVRNGDNPSIIITGVGKGNQTITFYVNDKAVKTVDLPGQLTETKSFAVKLLANLRPTGKYTVTATATQSDGRVSEIRQRLTFRIQFDTAGKYVRPSVTSTYIVHAGDSLWSIAARMLGDGQRWTEIQSANTNTIPALATQSTILPGWALTIPAP